jgi:hypothetical protein
MTLLFYKIRCSAVGVATSYWLDDREVGVQIPIGQEFQLLYIVQTGSVTNPDSYQVDTSSSFLLR